MERNPRECGNSACVGGVYICRIACIPCEKARKCALETIEDMTEALASVIRADQTKEKEKTDVKETNRP